jgi:hypothetical protein
MLFWRLVLGLALSVVVNTPGSALARVEEDLPWSYTQVFQGSIRLVRVDLGCTITERDAEAGFLLFDYESSGRLHHGSIELSPTRARDGSEVVRVVVQIPTLPSYVERMIVNRLERKLRDEIGEPLRPRAPAPPVEDRDEDEAEEHEGDAEPDEGDGERSTD